VGVVESRSKTPRKRKAEEGGEEGGEEGWEEEVVTRRSGRIRKTTKPFEQQSPPKKRQKTATPRKTRNNVKS